MVFFFGTSPVLAIQCGITVSYDISIWPSYLSPGTENLVKVKNYLGCVNLWTGRLEDCRYTFEVKGLRSPRDLSDNNGGHNHDFDTHPLIEPPQPPLGDGKLGVVGGDFQYVNNLLVSGQTKNQEVEITHQMPQVAGVIETEIFIYAPYGHYLIPCYSYEKRSYRAVGIIDVGILGFTRLDDSGDYHVVLRGGTDTHPDGTYGTSATTEELLMIAKKYFEKTNGRKLSINDMSLPKGGLFDYKTTWAPPHNTHRTGTDADINRAGVDCYYDKKLREAVEDVSDGQLRPYLQCEDAQHRPVPPDDPTGIYKHIDFD